MLELLNIKNVALIDELEITFAEGLNILSGETGAGKSIIIDSINFVLGGRIQKEFIRSGETTASVEALFYIHSSEVLDNLKELGVEINAEDGGALILSRSYNLDGKSAARINGRTVTISMLRELSANIIDIHGQHEHQSLLNPARHITLLDRFCGDKLFQHKITLAEIHKSYRETLKTIGQISQITSDLEAKIDLYSYQVKEIKAAKLHIGEEDELLEKKKRISNAEKLAELSNNILHCLYDGAGAVVEKLSMVQKYMESLNSIDESEFLDETSDALYEKIAELEDITKDFRRYAGSFPQDSGEQSIDGIEARLDIIYRLKKKYGRDISEILKFCAETEEKLNKMENSGEELERLNKLAKNLKKEAFDLCGKISKTRREAADKLSGQIESVLMELGMKDAAFSIEITQKDEFNADGFDKTEFLISANLGESPKPLSKIASGGEMSRVMLAIKTSLAEYDNIETFIFDEIDTGVSGRAAQMVSEKLAYLGRKHQILCITHLPQIAAMGDANFLIEKSERDGRATTGVTRLDRNGVTQELSRLTGGAEITSATIKAAEEMKKMADAIKNKNNTKEVQKHAD